MGMRQCTQAAEAAIARKEGEKERRKERKQERKTERKKLGKGKVRRSEGEENG
jgi:hypothetical protein